MARKKAKEPRVEGDTDQKLLAEFPDLPSTTDDGVPHYGRLLVRFHEACLAGDRETASAIAREAQALAIKLNGGTHFGIKGGDHTPCGILERGTAAPDGEVPLWGQAGSFVVEVRDCRVRVEMDGLYGTTFPAFSAHVVEKDRPFISPTGYRSFLVGDRADLTPGTTADAWARQVIEQEIDGELCGELVAIAPEHGGPPRETSATKPRKRRQKTPAKGQATVVAPSAAPTPTTSSNRELFAAYAKAAPLGDLRAYLRYAERKVAEYELPATTMSIIGEMFALERDLVAGIGSTANQKAKVWGLIYRFKESIPGWCGACGAGGSWVETVLPWEQLSRRYPGNPWEKVEAHRVAVAKAGAMHRFKVQVRETPLDSDQVQALIAAVTPDASAPLTPTRAPKKLKLVAAAIACPRCKADLTQDSPQVLRCASGCGDTWRLESQTLASHAPAKGRRPVRVAAETGRPKRLWHIHARTESGQDRHVIENHKAQADAAVTRLKAEGLEVVEVKARFDFTLQAMGLLEGAAA